DHLARDRAADVAAVAGRRVHEASERDLRARRRVVAHEPGVVRLSLAALGGARLARDVEVAEADRRAARRAARAAALEAARDDVEDARVDAEVVGHARVALEQARARSSPAAGDEGREPRDLDGRRADVALPDRGVAEIARAVAQVLREALAPDLGVDELGARGVEGDELLGRDEGEALGQVAGGVDEVLRPRLARL